MSFWQRILHFLGVAQHNPVVQAVEKSAIAAAEPAVVKAVDNASPAIVKPIADAAAQSTIDNLNKNIGQ